MILYKNGELAEDFEYKNPFENYHNWKNYGDISYTKNSIYYKDNLHTSIHLRGFAQETDASIYSQITNRNLANALSDKSKVKFKVYGDGNKYMFCIRTSNNGFFAKEFNTKKGDTTEVSLSIKSLDGRMFSKQSKYDGSEIVFAQIVPVLISGKEPACSAFFFDFEVEK